MTNKMRIKCDPYHEEIKYEWFESGEWKDLSQSDNSVFSNREYLNGNIAYKPVEIIQTLVKNHYCDNGLLIDFVGTDDDFNSFVKTRNTYFQEKNIIIERSNYQIIKASEALPKIDEIFKQLKEVFNSGEDDKELASLLYKYNDTVKPEIAICIMGLYSSGKSTFINSLIGKEILSSSAEPETAKIYKISNSNQTKVSFEYNNKLCEVSFDDEDWKFNNSDVNEDTLFSNMDEYFKNNDIKDSDNRLYYFLENLNKLAIQDNKKENSRIGDIIDISLPFGKTYLPLQKFDFVIYDTPGTNSASYPEHFEVLIKSLQKQTSGLPLLVSTPNSTDDNSYKELIKSQRLYGNALDLANLMIIVNQSDTVATDDLDKLKRNFERDGNILTEESKNVYFVSSIAGLGGKKILSDTGNEWVDKTYKKSFKYLKCDFSDKDSEDYMELYRFNILPKDLVDLTLNHNDVSCDNSIILWNSGIPSVELGIGNFAEKYALYNKCNQAIEILDKIAVKLQEKIEDNKYENQKSLDDLKYQMEKHQTDLMKKLKALENSSLKKLQQKFSDEIVHDLTKKYVGEHADQQIAGTIGKIKKECEENTKRQGKEKTINQFRDELNGKLDQQINNYISELKPKADKYWNDCKNTLSEQMAKIVVENDVLTEEQKNKLTTEINGYIHSVNMSIQISSQDFLKKINILWIKINKIDTTKAKDKFMDQLKNAINKINSINSIGSKTTISQYYHEVMNLCEISIADLNPELHEKCEQIKAKEIQLKHFENQLIKVKKCNKIISELLTEKEI